jgi:hypothetical protein
VAGLTRHPTEQWMDQVARNLTDSESGTLRDRGHVLHDAIQSSAPAFDPSCGTKACDRAGFLLALRM